VVVAPIDIGALRHERARRVGHDTVAHHRPEAYSYASQPGLPPINGPITIEALRARISASKEDSR
jgi:hypothetical protein